MMPEIIDDAERLACLTSLQILDTPPEREFDTIVAMAQKLLDCQVVLISMIDETRQWFKARRGLTVSETPREQAFCTHALRADDVLVVADATRDPRFADNPLVTGAPHIRFYAGMPIRMARTRGPGEIAVATLCVIDRRPRELDGAKVAALRDLAHLAGMLLAARRDTLTLTRLAEERRNTLDALARSNRQFGQAERMAKVGSWRLCLATHRTVWSDQTYAIHGVPVGDGTPLETALEFYPPHARALIEAAVSRTIATGEPFDIETDFRNAQDEALRVRSIGELELRDGVPVALIGVFQDITARHAMEQALRQTAYTDDLTGIASRSRFTLFLDEKVRAARESGDDLALLLIDLDHFKTVNDSGGHPAGDAVLRLMAARLREGAPAGSFAARIGGDEFALVVSGQAAREGLPPLVRHLLSELRHSVTAGGQVIHVSATIGACRFDEAVTSRSGLIQRADEALYRAKNSARGSAAISGAEGTIVAPDRTALRLVG